MCTTECLIFGIKNFTPSEIKGKDILEVGSYDVNGSLRSFIETFEPKQYIGVDIIEGPGVDIICDAEHLLDKFKRETFDVVISTELLEHARDWKKVISNIKNVTKGGEILITTVSYGFLYHAFPHDFWRYEIEDMKSIFSDCIIEKIENGRNSLGVFIKVRKPKNFTEKNLSDYQLYSIVVNKRVKEITEKDFRNIYFLSIQFRTLLRSMEARVVKYLENLTFGKGEK